MLTHPTYDRLLALGLTGMAKALEEQRRQRNVEGLSFEERLGLLVDREAVERESKRLVLRLKYANLRQSAVVEDLDTSAARGLDRALFAKLASGEWIARRQDLLITGKTGTGKSWLACALGQKACRDDRSVLYYRVPRLLDALALARGDGRYPRLLKSLARVELLVLDDWGLAPLTSQQGRDLLDIIDDRHGRGSTILTSQVPVKHWHELLSPMPFSIASCTPPTVSNWMGRRCAILKPAGGPNRPRPRRQQSRNPPPSQPREQKNERRTEHSARPRGPTGTSRARRCV
jgi:DNA replication protein DnaC